MIRERGPMQKVAYVLVLLGLTAIVHAGMFDLPEGSWRAHSPAEGNYRLEIGPPTEKTLKLTYTSPARDLRTTTWSGTYRVLAAKSDPHFKWTISKVESLGSQTPRPFKFEKGDTVNGLLQYGQDGRVTLTWFDEESKPIFTGEFRP